MKYRSVPALFGAVALLSGACTVGAAGPSTVAAPSPTAGAPAPTASESGVVWAFLREPSSIDPGRAVGSDDLLVVDQLFDSLTTVRADLEVAPAAAERWESNAEATVWTFHLRRGATFHDGTPVDADAFVRAWRRVADGRVEEPSPASYLLATVAGSEEARSGGPLPGVRAVDRHTLEVRLNAPFADFPAVVSHPALAPVPVSAVETPEDFATMPVGNGPFRMSEPWRPDQFIHLEASERYPGGQPTVDEIRFRIYTGDDATATAYEDFLGSSLDLAPIPEGRLDDALERFGRSDDGYRGPGVLDGLRLVTAFYGFNTTAPPFDVPEVRQAFSLLIDRETIVDSIADEGRLPAASVVPPSFGGYAPAECRFCRFDPEEAERLVGDREVGPVELVYYEGTEHQGVAERVQRDVNAALGPGTVRLRPVSQAEWLDAVRDGSARFFLSGWLAEYPAVDSFLYPLFHQGRVGTDNVTRYTNRKVSELLDAARRTVDPAARADLYRQAEAIVLAEVPVAPLFHYRHARVVSDRVDGLGVTPMGDIQLGDVPERASR